MPVRQLKSETFTNLVTALKERTALDAVKKDATNEFNRKNTVAANLFKKLLSENDFPAGTAVEIDGTKFTWAVSEGREIDPRDERIVELERRVDSLEGQTTSRRESARSTSAARKSAPTAGAAAEPERSASPDPAPG